MESGKYGATSFIHKPAVRIGIVVLVVHAVCYFGWNATHRDANNNIAATANAQHEKIRAAFDSKN